MIKRNNSDKENHIRIIKAIFVWSYIFIITFIVLMFLFSLHGNSALEILKTRNFYLSNGAVDGLLLIAYLLFYRIDTQKVALEANDLEDCKWIREKDLKKMKEFDVYKYKDSANHEDGIIIGAEKKNKDIEVVSTSNLHALIVGTTGSGKTTGFVDQNIECLAHTKTKPSIIITDPKKELYHKHAKQLEEQGYVIKVLDLREPYYSTGWNPFDILIRKMNLIHDLETNLQNRNGKYYAAGEEFLSYKDARVKDEELHAEIYEKCLDFAHTLCPVQNNNDPTWENGARNLIAGIILALCEDYLKGEVKEENLTLFNVYENIKKYATEDIDTLKRFLITNRSKDSKVISLVQPVLVTKDKTLTSYLSDVQRYIVNIGDPGVHTITAKGDLDVSHLDETPTAIFIILPDEKEIRSPIATLFVSLLYKELVEKANENYRKKETDSATLKRRTYFILDEFGNLPKFNKMDSMVTVGRSRGIRFLFILQSFSQLSKVYSSEEAGIIKSNCNVKIFIGTDDSDTKREFSELCGQRKIKSISLSSNGENQVSSSTGAQNKPLVSVGELERINGNMKGDAIVSVRGYAPIWSRFTPSYELEDTYFKAGIKEDDIKEAHIIDRDKIRYDIGGNTEEENIDQYIKEIEEKDKELLDGDIKKEKRKTNELDLEWQKIMDEINNKIEEVCSFLSQADAEAIRKADVRDKVALLFECMRRSNQTVQLKLSKTAVAIRDIEIPKLERLRAKTLGGKYGARR